MNYPQQAVRSVLEMIFPRKCIGCDAFSREKGSYLCTSCFRSIPMNKRLECIGCGRISSAGQTCSICRSTNPTDHLFAASTYNDPLTVKIIKTFKYRFIPEMALPTAVILKKYAVWLNKNKHWNMISDNPLIIPVPLHYRRLNWRGFNQSELMAKLFSDMTGSDFNSSVIRRIRLSKPQADIEKREERLKNQKYNFKITDQKLIKDRVIILIDDVCTTGATLNECAETLKENGAKKVIGLVIARG